MQAYKPGDVFTVANDHIRLLKSRLVLKAWTSKPHEIAACLDMPAPEEMAKDEYKQLYATYREAKMAALPILLDLGYIEVNTEYVMNDLGIWRKVGEPATMQVSMIVTQFHASGNQVIKIDGHTLEEAASILGDIVGQLKAPAA